MGGPKITKEASSYSVLLLKGHVLIKFTTCLVSPWMHTDIRTNCLLPNKQKAWLWTISKPYHRKLSQEIEEFLQSFGVTGFLNVQMVYLNFDIWCCLLVHPKPCIGDDLSSKEDATSEVQNYSGSVNNTSFWLLSLYLVAGGIWVCFIIVLILFFTIKRM